MIIIGSIGLASVSTIISAIIARAGNKNAIFPVLSFPVVLPIVIIGVKSLIHCIDGTLLSQIPLDIVIIVSYTIVIILLSVILFDYVWKE
jgi:heme exporter protein B